MVEIEFVHVPEGRTKVVGPYPFVQITYDVLQVGEDGEIELAGRNPEGFWEYNGENFTDVIISATSEKGSP